MARHLTETGYETGRRAGRRTGRIVAIVLIMALTVGGALVVRHLGGVLQSQLSASIGECVTADLGACTVCDSQHGAAAARKRLLRLQEARDGHRALPSRRFESAAERAQGLAVTVGAASALPAWAPAASAESVPAALALALSSALTPPALALASAAIPPSITSRR